MRTQCKQDIRGDCQQPAGEREAGISSSWSWSYGGKGTRRRGESSAAQVAVEKARLSSATSLDLSFQELTRLPKGLSSLVSLQSLDLRNNQFLVSWLLSPAERA